jgi:hypothetical protein
MNQYKRYHATVILLGIVMAFSLTGCQTVYHTLRFENHTTRAFEVVPNHKHPVEACSVVWERWVEDHVSGAISVTATYADTPEVAYANLVVPHTEADLGQVYDVIYQEEVTDPCPPAITDRFQVAVFNDSKVTLQASWKGAILGEVLPQQVVTFGPFTGSLSDRDQFGVAPVVAGDGQKPVLATHLMVNYKLGDVPTIEYVIND